MNRDDEEARLHCILIALETMKREAASLVHFAKGLPGDEDRPAWDLKETIANLKADLDLRSERIASRVRSFAELGGVKWSKIKP